MIAALAGVILDGTTATKSQAVQDLTIPEGEYSEVTLTVTGQNGIAINLTGYTAKLTARKSSSTTALVDYSIAPLVAASGTAKFVFLGADTDQHRGVYQFDVWIVETSTEKAYRVVPVSQLTITDAMYDA